MDCEHVNQLDKVQFVCFYTVCKSFFRDPGLLILINLSVERVVKQELIKKAFKGLTRFANCKRKLCGGIECGSFLEFTGQPSHTRSFVLT